MVDVVGTYIAGIQDVFRKRWSIAELIRTNDDDDDVEAVPEVTPMRRDPDKTPLFPEMQHIDIDKIARSVQSINTMEEADTLLQQHQDSVFNALRHQKIKPGQHNVRQHTYDQWIKSVAAHKEAVENYNQNVARHKMVGRDFLEQLKMPVTRTMIDVTVWQHELEVEMGLVPEKGHLLKDVKTLDEKRVVMSTMSQIVSLATMAEAEIEQRAAALVVDRAEKNPEFPQSGRSRAVSEENNKRLEDLFKEMQTAEYNIRDPGAREKAMANMREKHRNATMFDKKMAFSVLYRDGNNTNADKHDMEILGEVMPMPMLPCFLLLRTKIAAGREHNVLEEAYVYMHIDSLPFNRFLAQKIIAFLCVKYGVQETLEDLMLDILEQSDAETQDTLQEMLDALRMKKTSKLDAAFIGGIDDDKGKEKEGADEKKEEAAKQKRKENTMLCAVIIVAALSLMYPISRSVMKAVGYEVTTFTKVEKDYPDPLVDVQSQQFQTEFRDATTTLRHRKKLSNIVDYANQIQYLLSTAADADTTTTTPLLGPIAAPYIIFRTLAETEAAARLYVERYSRGDTRGYQGQRLLPGTSNSNSNSNSSSLISMSYRTNTPPSIILRDPNRPNSTIIASFQQQASILINFVNGQLRQSVLNNDVEHIARELRRNVDLIEPEGSEGQRLLLEEMINDGIDTIARWSNRIERETDLTFSDILFNPETTQELPLGVRAMFSAQLVRLLGSNADVALLVPQTPGAPSAEVVREIYSTATQIASLAEAQGQSSSDVASQIEATAGRIVETVPAIDIGASVHEMFGDRDPADPEVIHKLQGHTWTQADKKEAAYERAKNRTNFGDPTSVVNYMPNVLNFLSRIPGVSSVLAGIDAVYNFTTTVWNFITPDCFKYNYIQANFIQPFVNLRQYQAIGIDIAQMSSVVMMYFLLRTKTWFQSLREYSGVSLPTLDAWQANLAWKSIVFFGRSTLLTTYTLFSMRPGADIRSSYYVFPYLTDIRYWTSLLLVPFVPGLIVTVPFTVTKYALSAFSSILSWVFPWMPRLKLPVDWLKKGDKMFWVWLVIDTMIMLVVSDLYFKTIRSPEARNYTKTSAENFRWEMWNAVKANFYQFSSLAIVSGMAMLVLWFLNWKVHNDQKAQAARSRNIEEESMLRSGRASAPVRLRRRETRR